MICPTLWNCSGSLRNPSHYIKMADFCFKFFLHKWKKWKQIELFRISFTERQKNDNCVLIVCFSINRTVSSELSLTNNNFKLYILSHSFLWVSLSRWVKWLISLEAPVGLPIHFFLFPTPIMFSNASPISSQASPSLHTHLSSLLCMECDWQHLFGSEGLLVWIPRLWSSVVPPDLVLIRFLVWEERDFHCCCHHGKGGKILFFSLSLALPLSLFYQGIYSLDPESCCWITPVPDIKSHISSHPSTFTKRRV